MLPIGQALLKGAKKDTAYLRHVTLPYMKKQDRLSTFTATSYIRQFLPVVGIACPLISTCERGRTSREGIYQFYLNLNGNSPVIIEEVHDHDDDLHSRSYRKKIEPQLELVALKYLIKNSTSNGERMKFMSRSDQLEALIEESIDLTAFSSNLF